MTHAAYEDSTPTEYVERGGSTGGATIYFQMLGWNTVGLTYESWQSTGTPDLTPPVGPCNPIRVTASWTG